MIAHVRFANRDAAYEEVAVHLRPPVHRQRGDGDGEGGAEGIQERFGDRTDVALLCRIERRAVLKENLLRTEGLQEP